MSGEKKQIPPPSIPQTPSKAINDMLKKNCSKPFDNIFKAVAPYYICAIFQCITLVYNAIHQDKNRPSHKMWMISCGVISAVIVIKSYLVFKIVMGCTTLLYALLYYGAWLLALFGIGLGVSGMVFFDKDGFKEPSEGYASRASRPLYEAREEVTNRAASGYQEAREKFEDFKRD